MICPLCGCSAYDGDTFTPPKEHPFCLGAGCDLSPENLWLELGRSWYYTQRLARFLGDTTKAVEQIRAEMKKHETGSPGWLDLDWAVDLLTGVRP